MRNDGDVEATVHWHGLRLENRYDGVPHETQAPIPVGGDYTLPGAVPRRRVLLVPPAHPRGLRAWRWACTARSSSSPPTPPTGRRSTGELTLTLDDLLVEDGQIAPFSRSGPNFTAMGRFGNVMLINGETAFSGHGDGRRGRAPLPRQHREHPALQLRAAAARG